MQLDSNYKTCQHCLFNETIESIAINDDGICNLCEITNQFNTQYPSGDEGKKILEETVDQIKQDGRNKSYDCVLGVSGGGDSSYLMHLLKKEYGLRILAVHFDNTWNTHMATRNIHKMCKKLDIDLYTHVVAGNQFDAATMAFVKAGLRDIEIPSDIGFAQTINAAAIKHNIKWRIDGHSFRTEGVGPLAWGFIDGRYYKDVLSQDGDLSFADTLPNLTLASQMYMWIVKRIKLFRPLYYLDITKQESRELLAQEYNWEYYGGHHLDNLHTAFFHQYYFPRKWQVNTRIVEFSALMRYQKISREEALQKVDIEVAADLSKLLRYYKNRHELSDDAFENLMLIPPNSHMQYKTYKETFERLRPIFWIMLQNNLIAQSFYEKYCLPKK